MHVEQQMYASVRVDGKDYKPVPHQRVCNISSGDISKAQDYSCMKTIYKYDEISKLKDITFVKDISSGTMYGEGLTKAARSMYISKSSGLRCISLMDNPLLEAGFTNSLKLCLKHSGSIEFSDYD